MFALLTSLSGVRRYWSVFCSFYMLSMLCPVRDAPCGIHGIRCNVVKHGAALLHTAGTPCIDFSEMGDKMGLLGMTMAYLLTWTAQRRQIQEPIIVQECVAGFSDWILLDELPMYFVDWVIFSPRDLGWPIARRRKWCVRLDLESIKIRILELQT